MADAQYDQEFQKFFGAPPASAAKPPQSYDQEFQKFFGSAPPPVHDHEAAHQEHIQAVGDMLDNVRSVGDEITKRFAPVPIPPMLDNTTPDPRNLLQRTADAGLNMAGAALNAPQTAALGLGHLAQGARGAMGMDTPADIATPTVAAPTPGREMAQGANQVFKGGMDALMPFAGGAASTVRGAAALGGGMAMQAGVQKGLESVGVSPEYAELGGNVAGLAGGAAIHGGGGDYATKFKDFFGKEAPSAPAAKAEAAPAEAPVAEAPAVRSGGKPANRPASPFGVDEKPEPVAVEPVEAKAAEPEAKPVDEALVRKRPLVDENGEPILTSKGAPRSRVYGTKIDVEAQPDIAKAIDAGAAARAEAKGQAPEERSAMMREHVARLNDSIAAGEPVHMVYDSSKAENMDAPPDPATRQAEHEARLNDPTLSQEAAKSIVPESYSVSKGNDVLVHGKSLDKQLSNGEKLVQMAAGQKLKTPYSPETAGVEMALDLRKGLDKLPKAKQNFWALANRESPGTVFQRALEKRGIDPIDGMEETKETLRLDRIEKILKPDETPEVDAVRASAISGTLKTPVDAFTPVVKRALAKKAAKAEPAVPKSDADLEARLQASIEQAQAAKAAKAAAVTARAAEPVSGESRFTTEPAYGRSINIAVPGEQTRYKARYAVREASDVYASHNPQSFEANPDYEHANERDYSDPQNAARVVRDSSKDNFDPEFITSESPTAEHGPTIVDQRGNALGGNSRAMVVKRVYDSKNGTAAKYRSALEEKAPQFGISADDLQRFKDPVLVRERVGPVDATTEVADYNRKAAADLTPDEQAVADGKRISDQTMGKIMGNLEAGDHESLADALRGDNGAELVNSLEKDGMVSPQEKAGLIQGDSLTAVAKDRIAKAMVGRMFESSADLKNVAPDMRNKLEKIAPQVARVESREGWTLTPKVREALSLVEEMRAAGSKNVDQYFKQDLLGGEPRGEYSTESQAIAKTLLKGPMQAALAFRRYANEETNSRPGAAGNLFGALTQREAFEDAFVKRRGEAGSAPILMDLAQKVKDTISGKEDEPKANYSGMGAIRSKFAPNAAELRAAAPDDVYAAVRTATAPKQQAAVKLIETMPKIEAALGKDGPSLTDFKRVMVQDRLNATRDTWQAWAKDAESLSDKALLGSLKKGVNGLLWNMEAKNGMPVDLLQQATALADNGDVAGLRTMLKSTFEQAARSVKDVMSPDDFVEHSNKAGFQRGLDVYKAELEPMLEKQAAKTEGAFATTKGEFDTYYPLQDSTEVDATRINPLKERLNQAAAKSELGLGQYSAETKVLKDSLVKAFRKQDRGAAVDALTSSKMMEELTPGSEAGKVFVWNGKPLKAGTITVDGKTYVTAKAFAKDLEPVFAKGDLPDKGIIDKITGAGIQYAITGLMEPVFHAKNILGTMISRTPFVSKSFVGKTGEFIGRPLTQIVRLATTESMGDKFSQDSIDAMKWLAKNGALGERFGSQTYSKALADLTGGEVHRNSLGPTLSGPKGIDMRARIAVYKASMILEPEASVADRTKMVDQLGQYTRALWSEAQRNLPDWTSSFHVAGTTMYGNALKTGFGAEGIGERGLAGRASSMLFRGALGTTAMWALAYRAYTGKLPWNDEKSKFLKIPVNAEDRYSPLGQALWGTGSEQGYIDFSYVNPLAGRFGRTVGLDKAYETAVLGGSKTQIAEAAQTQMLNSAAHPFEGPLLKAAFVAATGNEPYLTGLRDDRGRMAPQFFNVTRSGGIPQRGMAAIRSLNPFIENVGEATGMLAPEKVAKGSKAAQMVNDLLGAPFAKPSDPYKKMQFLHKQERGMQRAQEKQ